MWGAVGIRFRIAIVLFVFGVIAIVYGVYEWRLASGASARPEEISLRDLVARGPDSNPNIILKDFALSDDFVHEYDEKLGPNSSWTKVWIPAYVPGAAPPAQRPGGFPFNPQPQQQPAGPIQAIILSTHVHNEADIQTRCAVPKLRAMVTNRIQSLGSEEKRLLQQSYPGTNFDKCLIIEEGREPASVGFLFLLFGGGLLLLAGGAGVLFVPMMLGWGGGGKTQLPRKLRPRRRKRGEEDEDQDEELAEGWQPPADERVQERPRRRRPADEDEPEEEEEPPRPRRRRPADDE
jgi:hypothetical protein